MNRSDRSERVLEVRLVRLVGSVLEPGNLILLTFSAGEGARTRTDPVTATGDIINLTSVLRVAFPENAKKLYCELHVIIGDNKTRVIGKGELSTQGGLIPRMSGGRTAEEAIDLRGTKDKVAIKHHLEICLTLLQPDQNTGVAAGTGAGELVNVQRIRMAMKRTEQKQRLRLRVETLTNKYKSAAKRRAGERHLAIDLIQAYNLPELPPGATPASGALVRVVSGAHGALSRVIAGTRHPVFAQSLAIKAASSVSFIIEDRGNPGLHTAVKYCEGSLAVRDLKPAATYLCHLNFAETAERLLAVVAPLSTLQEKMDKLTEDAGAQHLEILPSPLAEGVAIVARYRLLKESDEELADWRESDEHDGELEAQAITIARDREDEDGLNELKEKEDELAADSVEQQLAIMPSLSSLPRNAPPQRAIGFTCAGGFGGKYLRVELFVPEVPEKDDEGKEGENEDTPSMIYLAACVIDLAQVAALKETRVSKKKNAFKDPDAFCYRELKVNADLRVSEDGLEVLPPGVVIKNLEITLRLWDGGVLAAQLAKSGDLEGAQVTGFDSWLAQLKLVLVEEFTVEHKLAAIRAGGSAYLMAPQQSDRVLPEIETRLYTPFDDAGKATSEARLAVPRSQPTTPTRLPRIRAALPLRPRTAEHGVARRKGRPEVPTRPVTPITFTQLEVDNAVRRAVEEVTSRWQNKAEKERRAMLDRIDVLSGTLQSHVAEKTRFQMELDERSEAIRKCGVEIMQLRTQTKQLVADKSELQEALREREALHEQMLAVDEHSEMLDRGDLEQRLKLLSASYKEEKGRSKDLLVRMKHMHSELMRMEELTRAHTALQEAHSAQNLKIQELQEKKKKLSKYVATVQQQEQVIEKLEEMMEKALVEAREAKALRSEREGLERDLRQAKQELSLAHAALKGEGGGRWRRRRDTTNFQ